MVVDTFLLVCLLVFFLNGCKESFVFYFTSMFLSVNQGPKGMGWGERVFGVLELQNFLSLSPEPNPFSTWSPDRNADSGQIEPWS